MPHLSPKVHKHLTRLKGRLPADFAPVDQVVETPAGPRPVPPVIQELEAVRFPAGHVMVGRDEFEWEVHLGGFEAERGLIREDRAWYCVGHDQGQYYLLVDLDQAAGSDDPSTYRADHEGDEPVPWAVPLSERLAGIKVKRPPAKKYAFGIACANGELDAVRAGLGTAALGPVNATGATPLHLAALLSGSPELVGLLVDAGADVNAVVTGVPRMHAFAEKERLRGRDLRPSDTPLSAALQGFEYWSWRAAPVADRIAEILLDAGADPNALLRSGETVFTRIVALGHESAPDLVRRCLAAGALVHPATDDSPLRAATYGGDLEIIRMLLDAGADPCRPTRHRSWGVEEMTPLHSAAQYGRPEVLAALVAAAGDVDVRNPQGLTPLHIACARPEPGRVPVLLAAGADPQARATDPTALSSLQDGLVAHTPVEIARTLGRTEALAAFAGR